MTTITLPRATVEQALEALEAFLSDELRPYEAAKTAAALRAALAQQAEPGQAGCETEADCTSQPWCRFKGECLRRQAEPVEPVGDKLVSAAGLALEALQKDRQFAANAGRVFSMLSVRAIEELQEAFRELRTQQAEPVAVAERERIAAQWDGCVTHQLDTFGPVDIGASIRAGELVGPPQQGEPVAAVAENATTQQRAGETPPSNYRRGYWDGFNIGKREGRIEAEDALAQQAELVACACGPR